VDAVSLRLECVLFHIRQASDVGVATKGAHGVRPSHDEWEAKSQGSEEVLKLHDVVVGVCLIKTKTKMK